MSRQIDKTFKSALRDAIYQIGTQKGLADAAGIPRANIGKYLSGQIQVMRERTYQKLLPFLDLNKFSLEDKGPLELIYKSRHTKPLVEIFEQLDNDNQRQVVGFAENVLKEQDRERGAEFTPEESKHFAAIGVTCKYGMEFSITLSSLCWIYNVFLFGKLSSRILSNSNLKEMLKISLPANNCRELRLKLFTIDVYDDKPYDILVMYLNGSPPKFPTSYFCNNKICKIFTLSANVNTVFGLPDESVFDLHFSEQEYEDLKKGKTLKIPCPV
ncbi:MAG: hypothetical protein WCS27_00395 [Victivallaceae bacterium]